MIDGTNRSKAGSGRPLGSPGCAAPCRIEPLESRQMLSAHVPCAHGISNKAAIPADPPPAAVTVDVDSGDAPAVVQRLQPTTQFDGFDYTDAIAKNPPPTPATIATATNEFAAMTTPPSFVLTHSAAKVGKGFKGAVEHGGPPAISGGALTPLAQTPPALTLSGAPARPAGALPVTVVATPATNRSLFVASASGPMIVLGPAVTMIPQEVSYAAAQVMTGPVVEGLALASGKAADALAFVSASQEAVGAVALNFVHFNAAMIVNDAISSFAGESIALANDSAGHAVVSAPMSRAWTITAGVIAADLILLAYLFQRSRRDAAQRRGRMQSWGIEVEACPERVL